MPVTAGRPAVERRGLRAVPAEILRQVKRIELRTRGLVNSRFTGEYHSVFKGMGMEFAEVREYQPGDEVRTIDWNVSARMRRLFVKQNKLRLKGSMRSASIIVERPLMPSQKSTGSRAR